MGYTGELPEHKKYDKSEKQYPKSFFIIKF